MQGLSTSSVTSVSRWETESWRASDWPADGGKRGIITPVLQVACFYYIPDSEWGLSWIQVWFKSGKKKKKKKSHPKVTWVLNEDFGKNLSISTKVTHAIPVWALNVLFTQKILQTQKTGRLGPQTLLGSERATQKTSLHLYFILSNILVSWTITFPRDNQKTT